MLSWTWVSILGFSRLTLLTESDHHSVCRDRRRLGRTRHASAAKKVPKSHAPVVVPTRHAASDFHMASKRRTEHTYFMILAEEQYQARLSHGPGAMLLTLEYPADEDSWSSSGTWLDIFKVLPKTTL